MSEREYETQGDALTGALDVLNRQENTALLYALLTVFGLVILLGLGIGYSAGTSIAPSETQQKTVTVNLPNESVMHRTIAAARTDEIVDRFCNGHGFANGYPTADTNAHYFIRCYETDNGVDRSKQYPMFEDFADYVARGDWQRAGTEISPDGDTGE